jgi:hypothetical protein
MLSFTIYEQVIAWMAVRERLAGAQVVVSGVTQH